MDHKVKTFFEILQRDKKEGLELPDEFITTRRLAETMDQFCKLYNVSPAQLVGQSRQHHLVEVRHLCWWLCYTRLRLTYTLIGRLFNRHHTTIMHGIRQVDSIMETEPVLRDHINSIDLWIDVNKSTVVSVEEIHEIPQGHS
jgi:chromosomal replication initiation ATPase DnaA